MILYRLSIRELDVVNDQYQKLESLYALPRLLVGLHQYECHRQGGVSGFRSLGFFGSQAQCYRGRLNRLVARLKHLKNVSGLYRLNNEGERVFVNDEENDRIRKEFRTRVQNECDI
ncbi:hypothetical protein [Marinobacter sp. AC-23]|uniref:hypothetical protein n=1 Tax=Marinobacter sp. AC-23 TaxID=1879031 RepID=UPI0008DE0F52|nr:hypothetical protein [Marinobacter sp. AC-23]OHY80981.1 hypothetical protein BCA33_02985 [Marinobacter sp. AC-23]